MQVTIFNFYDYLKNPIAEYCTTGYRNPIIYTLDDLMPVVQKLKHSKWALENKKLSFIGDQLRLYLASKKDNFLYVDADCYIPDFKEILDNKNCTSLEFSKSAINNGTFFYSDSNCRFNKYYLDLYDKLPESQYSCVNSTIFKKFPFELDLEKHISGDMKLLTIEKRHFLLNTFYRFKNSYPNTDIIYYSKKPIGKIDKPLAWKIEACEDYSVFRLPKKEVWFFETLYNHIPQDTLFRLFKEQLNYTFQKTLQFVEI